MARESRLCKLGCSPVVSPINFDPNDLSSNPRKMLVEKNVRTLF